MCEIIPFPACFTHVTCDSAECELHLAAFQLQEARDRECDSLHAEVWYQFSVERYTQAERWVKAAFEQALYGP